VVSLGELGQRRARVRSRSDFGVCRCSGVDRIRGMVLSEDETASNHHMSKKLSLALGVLLLTLAERAGACAVCYGAPDSDSGRHMAVAVWVLMGVVMSVIGGVGAFSFHLWRHANTPLEPHQELTEEDLGRYE
jgi:hypothetical protein